MDGRMFLKPKEHPPRTGQLSGAGAWGSFLPSLLPCTPSYQLTPLDSEGAGKAPGGGQLGTILILCSLREGQSRWVGHRDSHLPPPASIKTLGAAA